MPPRWANSATVARKSSSRPNSISLWTWLIKHPKRNNTKRRGDASGCLESCVLPPNQYNEDSLPQAAILVFLFSWRDLGLAGQNAQKQVFSHGGTTENLKTSLSDPPNGCLISKTTLADPLIGHLISKTTLADPLIGCLISKITLPKRQNTSYIRATRPPISKNIWLSSKWDTRECYLLIIVKFGLSP